MDIKEMVKEKKEEFRLREGKGYVHQSVVDCYLLELICKLELRIKQLEDNK